MTTNNVGALDSWIRIFVGVWLAFGVLAGYIGPIGYLGFVLLATGLSRTCPGYFPFGFNTNRCNNQPHH